MRKELLRLAALVLIGYAGLALAQPANAAEDDPPWEGVCKSVAGTDPVWTYCDDSFWPFKNCTGTHCTEVRCSCTSGET